MKKLRIIPLKDLKIGALELDYLQNSIREALSGIVKGLLRKPGLIITRKADGSLEDTWKVVDGGGSGKITVKVGNGIALAFTADEKLICLSTDWTSGENFIPDGTTRNIILKHATTDLETGTISVLGLGGTAVTGTGTKFTSLNSKTATGYRGDRIRIAGSSQNNNGLYEIDTITDDTHLTLVSGPSGAAESGLSFSIAGSFFNANDPADPDIHEFDYFEIVATTAAAAENEYLLAIVKRSGNSLTIKDQRENTILSLIESVNGAIHLSVPSEELRYSFFTQNEGEDAHPSIVESFTRILFCAFRSTVGSIKIKAATSLDRGISWTPLPDPVTSGSPEQPFLVQLPDRTFVLAYFAASGADGIYIRTSTDFVTWSSAILVTSTPTLTTIANPFLLVLPNSDLLIFYVSVPNAGGGKFVCKKSSDGGASWGSEVQVITNGSAKDRGGAVVLNDGSILFVGTETSGNSADIIGALSSDSGTTWATVIVDNKELTSLPDWGPALFPIHFPTTNEVALFYQKIVGGRTNLKGAKLEDPGSTSQGVYYKHLTLMDDSLFPNLKWLNGIQLRSKEILLITENANASLVVHAVYPIIMAR